MKNNIVVLILGLSLTGCSNGFTSGTETSNGTPSLGTNDVVGAGGSLALMQSGSNLNVDTGIWQQAVGNGGVSFNGGWYTGCSPGASSNDNTSSEIYLAVKQYDAYMIIKMYTQSDDCTSGLDRIETRHYVFASTGTAPTSFAANTFSSFLVQVLAQPKTAQAKTDIERDCDDNGAPLTSGTVQVNQDFDVSLCKTYSKDFGTSNISAPKVGVTDWTGVFYTNGQILRLGDVSGLSTPGTVGYFTKQ